MAQIILVLTLLSSSAHAQKPTGELPEPPSQETILAIRLLDAIPVVSFLPELVICPFYNCQRTDPYNFVAQNLLGALPLLVTQGELAQYKDDYGYTEPYPAFVASSALIKRRDDINFVKILSEAQWSEEAN